MSENLLQPQDQHNLSEDVAFVLPICKFLLGAIVIWPFIALIATLLVVWLTPNTIDVSLFPVFSSPLYVFYRIFKSLLSLLPMDEKRFQLAQTKVQTLARMRLFNKHDKSKGQP